MPGCTIDKECHKCKKKGHFATVCQSGKKPLHTLGVLVKKNATMLVKKRHMQSLHKQKIQSSPGHLFSQQTT